MRHVWQQDRKGCPGGPGKGSGFTLSETEATGPYKMSSCGGFHTDASTTPWRGGPVTLPLNQGALATEQQNDVEVMLQLFQRPCHCPLVCGNICSSKSDSGIQSLPPLRLPSCQEEWEDKRNRAPVFLCCRRPFGPWLLPPNPPCMPHEACHVFPDCSAEAKLLNAMRTISSILIYIMFNLDNAADTV